MAKYYKDYFNINPKYYAAVTADLIKQGKVSWKDFYPHETFIKLLETTCRVLSGRANRSIWVEGAYGTGKSHAALTVKSMIDAPDKEVEDYFTEYGLRMDLCNTLISIKNSGKILTIHRIGSASIKTDMDLILAVQQSVMAALRDNGIENEGDVSMKGAFLAWLERPGSREYFNTLIHVDDKYAWDFSGMTVDSVVERLQQGTDEQIEFLMRNVMTVLKECGQTGLFKDINDLGNWIKSIIERNRLAAVLFVWDEFSEYFLNHPVGLTGFQTLIEISEAQPFYFMIVAHESRNLFADGTTAIKTLGRFEPPVKIDLLENIAFQLMAKAMKTTDDPVLSKEWEEEDKPTLNDELINVRSRIIDSVKKQNVAGKMTRLSDEELQGIVPIHPYAALLLKHIATVFNSNQRSMFDFIISNDMTDAKGFKWFINNYGIQSDINLLTIDLLWDFFCGKERNGLNDDVRGILDNYFTIQADKLLPEEQRVLKTILLLQAIALHVTGNELLAPNDENIELAFSGTDWQKGKAIAIAKGLIEKKLLFTKLIAGGKFEYCIVSSGGGESLEPYRKKVTNETDTQTLIGHGELYKAIDLAEAIKNRFLTDGNSTGYTNFKTTVDKLKTTVAIERFKVVSTFAVTDYEMHQIRQEIIKIMNRTDSQNALEPPDNTFIFIECLVPMGKDLYDRYIEYRTFNEYYTKKDKSQSQYYDLQATKVLNEWRDKIEKGAFNLYDSEHKGGERMNTLTDLKDTLRKINRNKYYYGLEQFTGLTKTVYGDFQLAKSAGLGIEQVATGTYLNIDKALAGAWKVDKYWENPEIQSLTIVHIKRKVDELIQAGLAGGAGRVSIMSILDELEKAPYGFMPSSIAAFVLGFVLKEYSTAEYFWSDASNNECMSVDKLKTMIASALKQKVNPSEKYKDEYIVTMTPATRSFLKCTAEAFDIPESQCSSVESARDQLRIRMKSFSFPLWCVKYVLKDSKLNCSGNLIEQIIDDYMGIANTANSGIASENDLADKIGNVVIEHPEVVSILTSLFTSENCRRGMIAFIDQYQEGKLSKLAGEIKDGGNYIDRVKACFNAEDANWVWNISTAKEKISDVILEYQIILESSKTLGSYSSLRDIVNEWNSKTNNIKISYKVVAKHTGDLGPFLKQLYLMKQSDDITEQRRQTFYDLLLTQRESFDKFYKDQFPYFIQAANTFLNGLSENEKAELYNGFSQGQFTKEPSDYYRYVETAVQEYAKKQWRKKLHDLWFKKTKTKDPADWSEKFETPILGMFAEQERNSIKKILETVMSLNPSEKDAQDAFEYLEKAEFYNLLADETKRDDCLRRCIIGDYSLLLRDVIAVRRNLIENLPNVRPYSWLDNYEVKNQVREMAEKQYKLEGSDLALQVIDKMDANQLRTYLREKIQDDVDFGIQILKGETA